MKPNSNLSKSIVGIEVIGRGGEVVLATLNDCCPALNRALEETRFTVQDILFDSEIRKKYNLPEWFELDNQAHVYGPLLEDGSECIIKIFIDGELKHKCAVNELYNANEEQVLLLEEVFFDWSNFPLFSGISWEKGLLFSKELILDKGYDFSLNLLSLKAKEFFINEQSLVLCIYEVVYDGIVLESDAQETRGTKIELDIYKN